MNRGAGPKRRSIKLKRAREVEEGEETHGASSSAAPAASSAAPPARGGGESFLVKLLLYFWSWGFISLVFVQKVCAAAVQDFEHQNATAPSDLIFFSKLGSSGAYPGNMGQQVNAYLQNSQLGDPEYVLMPLRMGKDVWRKVTQAIIMPHILFSKIYHHYKSAWATFISPGDETIKSFWQAMSDHPIYNIVRNREGGFMKNLVPLAMHGDDVPVTGVGKSWQKLVTVFSWFPFYKFYIIYLHTYTYTYIHTYVYTYIHACMHDIYIYIYIHMCKHI